MIPLVSLLTGWGVPARLVKPLLAVVAFLALASLIWAGIAHHDRNVIKQHDAAANAAVIAKTTRANDHAADQRATDAITLNHQEEETHHAIHSVPDAAPAAPSVRLGCRQLRRQGQDISRIPACG